MKKFNYGLLMLGVLAAGVITSCSDDSIWNGPEGEGAITLNFEMDSKVMRHTRADDTMSPVVPDKSQFCVALEKSDGSYANSWTSLEGFHREKSFPIGDYKISAFYGDIDREGFDAPYYYGDADVHVSPGAEADVSIVATLANAMVSVRYTDEFAEAFPQYSAAVQSEGHDWVVFASNETRPAYIAPQDVKLNLTLTNSAGQQQTIQPATFTALPRHHYVITIGVNGAASGDLSLDVQFDDDVVAETIHVSLGDDLFSSPAPTVSAKGFTHDTPISRFEFASAQNTQYDVIAFGGLKSATLTFISSDYSPAFGKSVELVNAPSLTAQQLAAEGVDCKGFFTNVDRMGVVNVTDLIQRLPAGNYTIQLQAVDNMTRVSEPVSLILNVTPVKIELSAPVSAEFMASEISVDLSTNCTDIKDNVTFTATNANNQIKPVEIKSVAVINPASPGLGYNFRYTLAIEPQVRANIEVEAQVGNKKADTKVQMQMPECNITTDAFAHYVKLAIDINPASAKEEFVNHLSFYNGADLIPTANVSYDKSSGLITIVGLTPALSYQNLSMMCANQSYPIPVFTTEAEADVTNGSFTATKQTININPIQVGGKYHVGAFDYYNRTSIVRAEPTGWASLNALTCYSGSNPLNTWFVVPSTFADNGTVTLRSVGYNHAGSVPSTSGSFGSRNYYCENAPTDAQLNKHAGELFLGSYSYNGSESRADGVTFSSRPSQLSFKYKYTPVNGEKGEAYIQILDAAGSVIASGNVKLSAAASMTTVNVPLAGYPFGKKAASIRLGFRSTEKGVTPSVVIPSGSDLKEDGVKLNTDYYWTLSENNYRALAVGSVLVIDDVALSYASSPAKSSKRVAKRVK